MKITIKNEVEIPDVTKFRKLFEKLVTKEGRTKLQDAIFYCSMLMNNSEDISDWSVEYILTDAPSGEVVDLLRDAFDPINIVVHYQYDDNPVNDKLHILVPEII